MMVMDGRQQPFSAGGSMEEIAQVMLEAGCVHAINLDGGGSTTLWLKGAPDNGVLNYPTDNQIFDHTGERSVSNIFYVK
jgi:exopolysaccharide biosynthesis protein